jgi:hypothetical protein
VKAGLQAGALVGGPGGRQQGSEALLSQVSTIQPLGVHQDGGEAGALELPGRPGPEAGRGFVERCPLTHEVSADGALRVERPKGGGRGLQGDLGGADSGKEGGISLQGGGDAEAKASEAQGRVS